MPKPGLNGFEVQTKPNTESVLAVRAALSGDAGDVAKRAALDAQRNRSAATRSVSARARS
jgi:hypothetical protein